MKKIIFSISIIILLLFFGYEILSESELILKTVNESLNLWIHHLFPSMFPFFVLSEILIYYGFIEFIGELFRPIFEKLFKINGNASFVFFMSMLSGFPSSAKYAKNAYLEEKLTIQEANKILLFSHFANPLFILGTISLTYLQDKKLGIIILISHYISNIILGITLRNYYPSKTTNQKFSLKNAIVNMHNKRIHNKVNFGTMITNSFMNSINTLLLILGVVTTFSIITTIINNQFHLTPFINSILRGILEMTQGLKSVSELPISSCFKGILMTGILSFGGLSVHIQIISIISDTNIKYLPFFISRIFHIVISIILFLVFYFFI